MRPAPSAFAAAFVVLLAVPTFAQDAAAPTMTVEGITSKGPVYELDVPSVEVTLGNIDEATIRALFNGDIAATAPALAALEAGYIKIPTLTLTTTVEGVESPTVVYRNLELYDVKHGVAGYAVLGGMDVAGGAAHVDMKFGKMTVRNFNIGGLLAFYGLGDGPTPAEPVTMYDNIKFAGGTVKAEQITCDIGPADIAEFKARPVAGGQSSLVTIAAQIQQEEKELGEPRPETVRAAIMAYIDFVSSFEMSAMEFAGLTCEGLSEKGQELAIAAGKVMVGGWTKATIPPISLSDFNVDIKDQGYVRFDNATLKKMDFTTTLTALASAEELDEDWFEDNWQKIMPLIEGASVDGLEVDVPDAEKPGERVKLSLGSFDITLGGYTNGIPASSELTVKDLKLMVPESVEDMPETLRAAGITEINLGFGLKFDWDPEKKTAELSNLSIDADQLGSAVISASLANVTPDVFSPDRRTQMRASQRITVTALNVRLDNAGLLNLLIARGAQESGQNDAAFRTGLIGITAGTTMALLGANPQTLGTVAAFSDFINGRPGLELHMTATDPRGIGLADIELMQKDPRLLAGRIQVSATASGDFPPAPAPAETTAPAAGTTGTAGEAGAATAQ